MALLIQAIEKGLVLSSVQQQKPPQQTIIKDQPQINVDEIDNGSSYNWSKGDNMNKGNTEVEEYSTKSSSSNEDSMSWKKSEVYQLLSNVKDKKKLTFSSDEKDVTDTANLMRYKDIHAYETLVVGHHSLEIGAVFDNVAHFKKVFNDIMIR